MCHLETLSNQNPGLDEKIKVSLLSTLPLHSSPSVLLVLVSWLACAFECIRSSFVSPLPSIPWLQGCPVHSGLWMGHPDSPQTLLLSHLEEGRNERTCQCVSFVCISLDTNIGEEFLCGAASIPPFWILLRQVVELFEEVWAFSVSGN